MLIGVISDTHDRLPMIDRALDLFVRRGVAAVIHPGDIVAPFAAKRLLAWKGPLHLTYGNNDGERAGLKKLLPQIQEGPLWVDLAGKRILVHHFIDWCRPEDVATADIVITGHTHEVTTHYEGRKLLLNPGECCGWVTGRCTVALLDTDGPAAEICELDEAR
ncbi:MAG TPA: metallophosphoesterase [Phycisphaerae bacterium]